MARLSEEQLLHITLLGGLIAARERELAALRWALHGAVRDAVQGLGLDPGVDYEVLPDGRLLPREAPEAAPAPQP